ncbi:helix-turn-helix domain-containing protein [Candidatus Uabimicrobium sp. HlEnr_7]|uniref:helix-turn-helix domain-containing protein n=1 Tax=Candidatus Uabimicrobium helgolandensis TaxID=3095367 RepID=UPI003558F575
MEKVDIGKIIRQGRVSKGISQRELAEEFNITVAAISSWERNITTPQAQMLIYLAEKLEIVDELFGRTSKKEDKIQQILDIVSKIDKKIDV